jgi:pyridoxine/pyridoxamine 5'-phosphate oxidase
MADHATVARDLIDSVQYMTLATADEGGRPWASPVWFAHEHHERFLWVSKPDALHSRNLAARPEVGIVIFDSTVPAGTGQAVYAEAVAEQLEEGEDEVALRVFSARSQAMGAPAWTIDAVRVPAPLRLYRATVSAMWVLGANDERVPVALG